MKKSLKTILFLLAFIVAASTLFSCNVVESVTTPNTSEVEFPSTGGSAETKENEAIPDDGIWKDAIYRSDTVLGSGSKTVFLEVKVGEHSITITVKTDRDILGEALSDNMIIEGDQGPFGLYIKKVNGITADYNIDKSYWSFYKNGEYMMSGVDSTVFSDGDHYELVYTK